MRQATIFELLDGSPMYIQVNVNDDKATVETVCNIVYEGLSIAGYSEVED